MKHIKLFEQFINEVKFADVEAFKAYAQKHKMRPNTVVNIGGKDIKAGEVGKEKGEEKEEDAPGKEVDTKEMTVYHTSGVPLKELSSRPMWFTKSKELAKAYDFNNIESGGGDEAFTYQIKVVGKILGLDEVAAFAEEAGIDQEQKVIELTENPGPEEVKKLIKPYMKICDGFDHWDYDPRDWGDAESTIIFNPNKSCTIVKRIKFNHEEE